jgi:hypothetical protein
MLFRLWCKVVNDVSVGHTLFEVIRHIDKLFFFFHFASREGRGKDHGGSLSFDYRYGEGA